jgi:leader peptidase (prepilin peptidase)/N-methyltransferase
MTCLAFGVFAFVVGTMIGSFLNVCIYRLPRGESIVYPPSHCPDCYQAIRWEDNIPVLSWFLLGGRCRVCRDRISLIYPAVEFLTGAFFFAHYWRLVGFEAGPSARMLAVYAVHVAFVSALLAATVVDFKHLIIPDEITIPGTVIALCASFVLRGLDADPVSSAYPHMSSLAASLAGAAVGAGTIYGIGAAGKVVLRREAMGFGDVKLMAMIGAVLGWQTTVLVLFASALLGTLYGAVHMVITGDTKIPYGPFLSIAAAGCLLMRPEVNDFVASVLRSYRFLLR